MAIQRADARPVRIDGSRGDVTDACLEAVEGDRGDTEDDEAPFQTGTGWYASHAWNPAFYAGTMTFAFEVAAQRDWTVPDAIVLPIGHGTLFWRVSRLLAARGSRYRRRDTAIARRSVYRSRTDRRGTRSPGRRRGRSRRRHRGWNSGRGTRSPGGTPRSGRVNRRRRHRARRRPHRERARPTPPRRLLRRTHVRSRRRPSRSTARWESSTATRTSSFR